MWVRALGALVVLTLAAGASLAADVTDAEVLAITHKHCVMCHARMPTHEAFTKPPRNVVLETIDDVAKFAPKVLGQAVEDRTMPLGDANNMTDEERETLRRWIAAHE
jgi:uncharacterized membrane protein